MTRAVVRRSLTGTQPSTINNPAPGPQPCITRSCCRSPATTVQKNVTADGFVDTTFVISNAALTPYLRRTTRSVWSSA